MTAFEQYLKQGQALIKASLLVDNDLYEDVCEELPCADFLWNPDTRVFAYLWVGDEGRIHAFRIYRIEEDDYLVTLFFAHGKLELEPIWNIGQQQLITKWRAGSNQAELRRYLEIAVEQVAESPVEEPLSWPQHLYQVVVELRPVQREAATDWAVAGAWAASDEEIDIYMLPDHYIVEQSYKGNLPTVEDRSGRCLEILKYWWEHAYPPVVQRLWRDPVYASSARTAAIKGVRQAQEEESLAAQAAYGHPEEAT